MKSTIQFTLFTASIFILLISFSVKAQEEKVDGSELYSKNIVTNDYLRSFYESFLNKETIDYFNRFRCLNSGSYPTIEINEASLGMLTCGTNDIEYVIERLPVKSDLRIAPVTEAIEKYEADFHEMKIPSAYDRYFPVTVFLQGKSRYPFRRVNVDAITWLSNNIIPSPDMVINGVNAQTIYDTSFKNFFHAMKFYYDYLHNELDIEYELMLYQEMINEEDSQWAGNWLHFWYNRKDYGTHVNPDVKPHQFMGFWLRRELDGSADALYSALLKIIKLYDKSLTLKLIDNTLSFIPTGYEISEEAEGDLNNDFRRDKVIAIKNRSDNTEPVKIIVLIQNDALTFQKYQESSRIIPPEYTSDGVRVFDTTSVSIEGNDLVVGTWGFTSNTKSTFRFIDGQLRLINIQEFVYSQSVLWIDLIASTVKKSDTTSSNENTTTTTFQFPEIEFENANPDEVVENATKKPAGESLVGTLISGGGIDNYSLTVQTYQGEKISVYCQPNCGDWFDNKTDGDGVTIKNSIKDKQVLIIYTVEKNNGRLAGPSDDEKFIFLKHFEFLE